MFGCKAFVHIPKDKRSKLDDKTKPCIFLGYAREEFGYRLWDLVNIKIIKRRDVVFLKDQVHDDAKDKPESNSEVPANVDPAPSPTLSVGPSVTSRKHVEGGGG